MYRGRVLLAPHPSGVLCRPLDQLARIDNGPFAPRWGAAFHTFSVSINIAPRWRATGRHRTQIELELDSSSNAS